MLVNDNSTGNDQIIAATGITTRGRPQGQDDRRRAGHGRPLPAAAGAAEGRADRAATSPSSRCSTDDAAAAFAPGQVDAVGAFAPFTTTALERPGSKAIATSKDFPGAIPDHLVVRRAASWPTHPTEVQAVVKTWFDTLDWIERATRTRRVDDHGEARPVSRAADYTSPTTPAPRSSPGSRTSTPSPPAPPRPTWTTRPTRSPTSWSTPGWPTSKPSLDGLFEPEVRQGGRRVTDPSAVRQATADDATARSGVVGAAPAPAAPAARRRSPRCGCRSRGRARWVLAALSIARPAGRLVGAERQRRRRAGQLPADAGGRRSRPGCEMARAGSSSPTRWASVQRVLLGFGLAVADLGAAGPADGQLPRRPGRCSSRSSGCCATCRRRRSSRCSSSGSGSASRRRSRSSSSARSSSTP